MSITNPSLERAIIAISGEDAVHYLQGILTQDVVKLAEAGLQFSALLSPQGKILHDMFLVADGERILLDTPALYKEILRKRLAMYKLRAKVTITDISDQLQVYYSDHVGLVDPRHGNLPKRFYGMAAPENTLSPEEYRVRCLALGIPDSAIDFAPDEVVALDAGYDLLHGVSFTKGCYVGQEVTARMHYKQIARRGFYVLTSDIAPTRLALLKFDEVQKAETPLVIDGVPYHPQLPEWMAPKLAQFLTPHSG